MRLIDRRDTPLAIALVVGTATMFAQPLRFVLSVAEDVSRTYHIDLIPGLLIFGVVFIVHFWRKYRDATIEVQRAAADAEQARRTAESMTCLVTASHAIASARDFDALRVHACSQLPPLLGPVPVWLAIKHGEEWYWIIEPSTSAEALLKWVPALVQGVGTGTCVHEGWGLFPLGPASSAVGLLGVQDSAARSATETAHINTIAAVIGIAVRNIQLFEQLQTASITDPLTGCVNRAYAFEALNSELRRARRTSSPLAVLMLDVNDFKEVNDHYGHVWGDRLLAGIADTLRQTLRTSDVKCRYGGDEFLVVLPDTPADAAHHVVANVRRALHEIQLQGPEGVIACRVSIGMAAAEPGELDVVALILRADAALYADKPRTRLSRRLTAFATSPSFATSTT